MNPRALAISARFGGLGISNPADLCKLAFKASKALAAPLTELIRQQKTSFDPIIIKSLQQKTRACLRTEADERAKAKLEEIERTAPEDLKLAIKIACEKGASCWLTARPLEAHSTILHKGDFRDAIRLRYKWQLSDLPEKCACGAFFTFEHSLKCMFGGFRGILHNDASRILYHAFKEAGFKDVRLEPALQPLTGKS